MRLGHLVGQDSNWTRVNLVKKDRESIIGLLSGKRGLSIVSSEPNTSRIGLTGADTLLAACLHWPGAACCLSPRIEHRPGASPRPRQTRDKESIGCDVSWRGGMARIT